MPASLVEHEDVDVVVKQPADRDFLLVAARQLAGFLRGPGALDVELGDPARGRRALA